MQILIIGGGGREHALAWKCAQSDRVTKMYVAPGNAGTATESKCENLSIAAEDIQGLLEFALEKKIDLTIVGPEAPLVEGVVDRFQDHKLRCFGPSRAAAQLEGSKVFTKEFLVRHEIPTAAYQAFDDAEAAYAYIEIMDLPMVVKADGLAAGKGVTVAQTKQQAVQAVADCLGGKKFGAAGNTVVIEECLLGEEASFICMVGGEHILPLATSQDHKARDDGDQGPNTGGMGAYSPAPVVTDAMHVRVMREVIEPTVKGLAADGIPYTGFLYAGLMIAADGTPKVLEYNCRFGDPETQPILMRLQSDLVTMCEAALDGGLNKVQAQWDPRVALGVVMAAGGYPENYNKGDTILGLEEIPADVKVFHAGTDLRNDGAVVTNGGRVLCVTALGDTVAAAQTEVYAAIERIHWTGCYFRKDIGYRAIARETI